jgi:hypothetical protein
MIYEIFKAFSVDGLTWGEFASGIYLSLHLIYISLWVIGWVACWGYKFIQDDEATIPNFMNKLFDKLLGNRRPDGWYMVTGLGVYYRYSGGKRVERSLGRPLSGCSTEVPPYVSDSRGFLINCAALLLGTAALFIDLFPGTAAGIAGMYILLLVARKAVRLGKKLTKHIEDKSIHKTEEAA